MWTRSSAPRRAARLPSGTSAAAGRERSDQRAQQDRRQSVPDRGGVDAVDQRHAEQHQHAAERDAEFDLGIDAQRVLALRAT